MGYPLSLWWSLADLKRSRLRFFGSDLRQSECGVFLGLHQIMTPPAKGCASFFSGCLGSLFWLHLPAHLGFLKVFQAVWSWMKIRLVSSIETFQGRPSSFEVLFDPEPLFPIAYAVFIRRAVLFSFTELVWMIGGVRTLVLCDQTRPRSIIRTLLL